MTDALILVQESQMREMRMDGRMQVLKDFFVDVLQVHARRAPSPTRLSTLILTRLSHNPDFSNF